MEEDITTEISKIVEYCRARQCEECQYWTNGTDCALRNPSMWEV